MIIVIMKRLGLTGLLLLLPALVLAAPTLPAFDLEDEAPSWGLIQGVTPTGGVSGRARPSSTHGSPRAPIYQRGDTTRQVEPTLTANHTLSVIVTGAGTVHTNLVDIDCRAACGQGFKPGSEIILTAEPDPGYRFVGWSGVCSGTEDCPVVMDQHKSVGAKFSAKNLVR